MTNKPSGIAADRGSNVWPTSHARIRSDSEQSTFVRRDLPLHTAVTKDGISMSAPYVLLHCRKSIPLIRNHTTTTSREQLPTLCCLCVCHVLEGQWKYPIYIHEEVDLFGWGDRMLHFTSHFLSFSLLRIILKFKSTYRWSQRKRHWLHYKKFWVN